VERHLIELDRGAAPGVSGPGVHRLVSFASSSTKRQGAWAEKAYPNLIYFNEVDKGGRFAAWEQPQLFSEEVRAGFRSLR
jgi:hypothetical protein